MSKAKRLSAQKVSQKATVPFPKDDFNFDDEDYSSVDKFKNLSSIEYKTDNQKKYWDLIGEKEMTFCSGPAGTGKSFISLAKALQLFSKERKKYKKIIIVKPAVEANDEKMGYLPGNIDDKIFPYIFSSKYILEKILGKPKIDNLFAKGKIEIMALAYCRGITIDNSIVVCEEAQNMTVLAMRTLLTRIGENGKFIISGDLSQQDRVLKNGDRNGLQFAIDKLKNIKEIGVMEFTEFDIVRNPLISKILKEFNGDVK